MNAVETHHQNRGKLQRLVPSWESVMGQMVMVLWLILVFANVQIDLLQELQASAILKGLSGLLLFVGLTIQASLSLKRIFPDGDARLNLKKMLLHKRIGNYLPLVLVLHASGFGYGLNLLLSCTLLVNLAQGWWGTQSKGGWYIKAVGVHVVLGILLYSLSIYHAVIALMFHSHF
jgi:hypothetical protein